MKAWVRDVIDARRKRALPVLSFPGIQGMDVGVDTLVRDAGIQAACMRRVADRVDSAAAVSFMDLSVEAECFGATIRYGDREVPSVTGCLVQEPEDAASLRIPRVGAGRTRVCIETIMQAVEEIGDRPVLAGAIGPFSLAGRLMDVSRTMYHCYDEPEMVHDVVKKATEFITAYCIALREAGANGVIVAEPLAGIVPPSMAEKFSTSYMQQIVREIQTESFAVIYHNCGGSAPKMMDSLPEIGASGYHFGNAASMADVLDKAPADTLIMGNIDPASQFCGGTPESMARTVDALLAECGDHANYVISSGCDIPPDASWDNIHAFFAAVDAYYTRIQ